MRVKIKMWGNSLALRLPKKIALAKNLHLNDEVELKIEEGCIRVSKVEQPETLADLLAVGSADAFVLSAEDKNWLNA